MRAFIRRIRNSMKEDWDRKISLNTKSTSSKSSSQKDSNKKKKPKKSPSQQKISKDIDIDI